MFFLFRLITNKTKFCCKDRHFITFGRQIPAMKLSRLLQLLLPLVLLPVFGCKNKHVSEDVKRYCACLAENQQNPDGRTKCLDLMDEIKAKYAGDNRALLQILKETDGCL